MIAFFLICICLSQPDEVDDTSALLHVEVPRRRRCVPVIATCATGLFLCATQGLFSSHAHQAHGNIIDNDATNLTPPEATMQRINAYAKDKYQHGIELLKATNLFPEGEEEIQEFLEYARSKVDVLIEFPEKVLEHFGNSIEDRYKNLWEVGQTDFGDPSDRYRWKRYVAEYYISLGELECFSQINPSYRPKYAQMNLWQTANSRRQGDKFFLVMKKSPESLMTLTPMDSLSEFYFADKEPFDSQSMKKDIADHCKSRDAKNDYNYFLGTMTHNSWPIAHFRHDFLKNMVDVWRGNYSPIDLSKSIATFAQDIYATNAFPEVQIYSPIRLHKDVEFVVGPNLKSVCFRTKWYISRILRIHELHQGSFHGYLTYDEYDEVLRKRMKDTGDQQKAERLLRKKK